MRKKIFSAVKEVRAIARERVGRVPTAKAMLPKTLRKKPKYGKLEEERSDSCF